MGHVVHHSPPVAVGHRRSFTLFVIRVQVNTHDALMYSRMVAAFLKRVMSTVFFQQMTKSDEVKQKKRPFCLAVFCLFPSAQMTTERNDHLC